ncbi:MAG: hypothetical protein AAF772_00405 [Acidobacteriota bacterium]
MAPSRDTAAARRTTRWCGLALGLSLSLVALPTHADAPPAADAPITDAPAASAAPLDADAAAKRLAVQKAASDAKKAQLGLTKDRSKPKNEFPGEAAAWRARFLQTPNDVSPIRLNLDAKAAIEAREAAQRGALDVPNAFIESLGPGNLGGRVRGVVVDPNDPDTLLVGSVSGGLIKTEDGGQTWRIINDFLPSLAIGSLLVDPDDPNTVWAGTGEGFFNVDAARGLGIYKSTDFGETWTVVANTENSDFHFVNRLVRIPGTGVLIAATRTGLWRTTNEGLVWREVSGIVTNSRGFTDIQYDPSLTSRIYAYHFGSGNATRRLYRSTDFGNNWTELGATEGIPTTNIRRMEIGVGTDGVVYLSVANGNDATNGLYRSTPGGDAFRQTASTTAFIERQGWYDLPIAVDPTDSDIVYMGAVDLFRTTNAGTTITKQTFWNPGAGQGPQFVHADHHAIVFHPTNPQIFWVGTDGGVFRTDDGGNTYVDLNNDVRLTQFYGIAVSPDGERAIAGNQDNGSVLYFGNEASWILFWGGDGGYCAWDQQDPNFLWGANPNGGMFVSADGGLSITQIALPDTVGAAFITPFTIDPNDGNRVMVGTDNVFLTENGRLGAAATWSDASGTLGGISAIEFSPLDGTIGYAGTFGGQLSRITDLGGANTVTTINNNLPAGSAITGIEVDVNDPSGDTIFVTLGNYAADRVWKTTNGGASWSSIAGDLPGIPLFDLKVDPTDPNRLWLGSELGLWTTTDNPAEGAISWNRYDFGVAWTRVQQLIWSDDNTLWVGTHGRGMFRVNRSPLQVEISDTVIDSALCDADGVLDDGERAVLPVTVENLGEAGVGSVTVTLTSADPSLDVFRETLDFGSIPAGDAVTGDFEVILDLASCVDRIDLTATATWSGVSTSTTRGLLVGADVAETTGTFADGAESADTQLISNLELGLTGWSRVTTQANTGTSSWFTPDEENFTDKSLVSPVLEMLPGGNVLTFSLYYDMEGDPSQYWDGTLLEMRVGDGPWFDIGNLSTVPYDGPLFTNNTASQRPAWSGVQTTWRDATVDLGTTYEGEQIQFRFRTICDTLAANVGFWVDDIAMTNVRYDEAPTCDTGVCDAIFDDGVETNDTSRWSATVGGS